MAFCSRHQSSLHQAAHEGCACTSCTCDPKQHREAAPSHWACQLSATSPSPPPRTRVAATACKEEKAPHAASPPTVNAWNLSGKGSLVTHSAVVTHNAWTSAVHQVNNSLCSCLYMEVQSSIKWSRCFCHGVICHLWTAKAVLQLLLLYRVAFNNRLDRVAAHSSSIKLVAASAKLSSTMMHSADFVPFCHHLYTECITPSLH